MTKRESEPFFFFLYWILTRRSRIVGGDYKKFVVGTPDLKGNFASRWRDGGEESRVDPARRRRRRRFGCTRFVSRDLKIWKFVEESKDISLSNFSDLFGEGNVWIRDY